MRDACPVCFQSAPTGVAGRLCWLWELAVPATGADSQVIHQYGAPLQLEPKLPLQGHRGGVVCGRGTDVSDNQSREIADYDLNAEPGKACRAAA